jgi:hypothetical protein
LLGYQWNNIDDETVSAGRILRFNIFTMVVLKGLTNFIATA